MIDVFSYTKPFCDKSVGLTSAERLELEEDTTAEKRGLCKFEHKGNEGKKKRNVTNFKRW